jgi:hypothetical protein
METMEIGWSIWTTFQPFPWKCFEEIRLDNVHGNHGNRLEYLDYFPAFSMEMFCRNQAGQCPWKPWKKAGVFGLLSSLFHGNVLWKSGWTLSMETMDVGWTQNMALR